MAWFKKSNDDSCCDIKIEEVEEECCEGEKDKQDACCTTK